MTKLLFYRILDTFVAATLSAAAYFEAGHSVSICIIMFVMLLVLFNIDGYITEKRMKYRSLSNTEPKPYENTSIHSS